jgi:hypothetical protein
MDGSCVLSCAWQWNLCGADHPYLQAIAVNARAFQQTIVGGGKPPRLRQLRTGQMQRVERSEPQSRQLASTIGGAPVRCDVNDGHRKPEASRQPSILTWIAIVFGVVRWRVHEPNAADG